MNLSRLVKMELMTDSSDWCQGRGRPFRVHTLVGLTHIGKVCAIFAIELIQSQLVIIL